MHEFERRLLRRYAANSLTAGRFGSKPTIALLKWFQEHTRLTGARIPTDAQSEEFFDDDAPLALEMRKRLQPVLGKLRPTGPEPRPSPLELRLSWLKETLNLTDLDAELLGCAVRFAVSKPFHSLLGISGRFESSSYIQLSGLGGVLHRTASALQARLHKSMPLVSLGLVERPMGDDWMEPSSTALRIAKAISTDPASLRSLLLGKSTAPTLEWADFDHLGAARDLMERALGAALTGRGKGLNLLLHGSPGTGKTEFVRTLAARLGARAVFVGETDDEDGEPTRSERIAAFRLARVVARNTDRTILVMDEADDVFLGVDDDDSERRRGSKVYMNRLVETTGAPVIWVTNAPERLGRPVLRRMDLALGFPEPGPALRTRMVGRVLERSRRSLGKGGIERLSALEAPPSVIDRALRVARLVKGKAPEAELAATSILTVMKGRAVPPKSATCAPRFDPALSAADCDLEALATRAADSCRVNARLDLSFCLYGISGTGKSAYARYLASRLGFDVLEKRASDIIAPYVGETEANIAGAFREAADKRMMLVIDEADSFLRDRAGAQRSWEVTAVNEMLTWMERHPLPIVFTTNLMESIDPATLRRFVFKVRFLPLRSDQVGAAFRAAFGCQPPPSLARLDSLTPGDFAVVARKAAVLGEQDPEHLCVYLREELAARPRVESRRIGFQV